MSASRDGNGTRTGEGKRGRRDRALRRQAEARHRSLLARLRGEGVRAPESPASSTGIESQDPIR